jgi:hypothetical protein
MQGAEELITNQNKCYMCILVSYIEDMHDLGLMMILRLFAYPDNALDKMWQITSKEMLPHVKYCDVEVTISILYKARI